MNEKIKVNVSLSVYNILKKDMELFEFFKQDFKLNKNLFYVTLISNYYDLFNEQEKERTNLIKKYLKDNSNMSDSHLNQISVELSKKLGEVKSYDEDEKYDIALSIKPTKSSMAAISYIENYLLTNISLSNFYRNMFSSYARLPQDLREQIIFKSAYDIIQQAIKENKKLFIVTTANKPNEVSPYILTKSKEELFNYLLCINSNNKPITYRLSRLKDITILNDQRVIYESEKELLDRMIETGPQYRITTLDQDLILVKLTDSGINQFKTSYVNRPEPIKIENNMYTFNCSYSQIHQYFRRFGSNATVLQPKELQYRLKQFYKQAFYHYRNLEEKDIT